MAQDKDREIRGLQEMLFLVLEEVGEPVKIEASRLKEGLGGDKMIDIVLDDDEVYWTFSIKDVPNV